MTCLVEGCTRPVAARKMCMLHYHRQWRESKRSTEGFTYWVNVYQGFVDMGGRTRADADLLHRDMVELDVEANQRLACRLLRWDGVRLIDITEQATSQNLP